MKIVFMGTPEFAVPTLEALVEKGHEVGYVVSQPDAAKDRGKKVKYTPVKEKALELGLEVLQPEKIKGNQEFLEILEKYNPDAIIVAAYGKLLPKEILELPRLGCINVHGSLLPRFRGAAPIQRAILEGDEVTGITIMQMEEGLDTGDMYSKVEVSIDGKYSSQLHDELALAGGKLLVDTLEGIENGTIKGEKQDDSQSTYAKMIFKGDGKIDFTNSPEQIDRQIRALTPWPSAFTTYDGANVKIQKGSKVNDLSNEELEAIEKYEKGTILDVSAQGIKVIAGNGIFQIEELQFPNKKSMKVEDYLRGNTIDKFKVLG